MASPFLVGDVPVATTWRWPPVRGHFSP